VTPAAAIAALDRQLAVHGETVTLRRDTAGPGAATVALTVELRAIVRGFTPADQEGFAVQGDTILVISPTEMTARQWCWPPQAGDHVTLRGYDRVVRAPDLVRVDDVLVRINLAVRGAGMGR
jgi:hypothetical protein